mgnify:FL=1
MKIVFCTQNMAPFRMKWMDEIAKYHEVIIYHLGEYESGVNKKYISYIPERAVVHCDKKKRAMWGELYDESKIIDESADLYLLDGYGFKAQQHMIITLKRKNIPFIISVDGGFIRSDENVIKKHIKSHIMKKANAFLSTSEETDSFIRYYVGKDKKIYRHMFSSVSDNYIEKRPLQSDEKNVLRKELKMPNGFSIITVGKFEYRKGFDILIEAAKSLKGEYNIYFIGASNREIYQNLITDDIKEKIRFVDFCDKEKLKKYYMASDLFILPTREDIWGLVITEAMSNGIPVITTDKCLAGVAMLEKDEIINAESINAIVDVVHRQMELSNKERMDIGVRNIEKARKYSIENATKSDLVSFKDFQMKKLEYK